MKIDVMKLKRLAQKAATKHLCWRGNNNTHSFWECDPEAQAAFQRAFGPQVALALIARLETLEAERKGGSRA